MQSMAVRVTRRSSTSCCGSVAQGVSRFLGGKAYHTYDHMQYIRSGRRRGMMHDAWPCMAQLHPCPFHFVSVGCSEELRTKERRGHIACWNMERSRWRMAVLSSNFYGSGPVLTGARKPTRAGRRGGMEARVVLGRVLRFSCAGWSQKEWDEWRNGKQSWRWDTQGVNSRGLFPQACDASWHA